MELAARILADISPVFLNTGEFAESLTHFAGGAGEGVEVPALVTLEPPDLSHEHGAQERQEAVLHVAADLTLTLNDAWGIRGKRYQTVSLQPADSGLRRVTVVRVNTLSRWREQGAVL